MTAQQISVFSIHYAQGLILKKCILIGGRGRESEECCGGSDGTGRGKELRFSYKKKTQKFKAPTIWRFSHMHSLFRSVFRSYIGRPRYACWHLTSKLPCIVISEIGYVVVVSIEDFKHLVALAALEVGMDKRWGVKNPSCLVDIMEVRKSACIRNSCLICQSRVPKSTAHIWTHAWVFSQRKNSHRTHNQCLLENWTAVNFYTAWRILTLFTQQRPSSFIAFSTG